MIQPSFLNLIIMGAMLVIFAFAWRTAAARYSETPIGQAMAYIL